MLTLKFRFSIVLTPTGPAGSITVTNPSYARDVNMPSIGKIAGNIIYFNRDGGLWNEVRFMAFDFGSGYEYRIYARKTGDADYTVYSGLTATDVTEPDGSWTSTLVIPQAVADIIKACKYANYTPPTGAVSGTDFTITGFTAPSSYSTTMQYVSYTLSNFSTLLLEDNLEFMDSSVTVSNPNPGSYTGTVTSPLKFAPDIFWTNRRNCVEF